MKHWSERLRDAVDFAGEAEPEHNHPALEETTDCAACWIEVIRDALRDFDAEPEMTIADVGGPCDHDPQEWAGRVEAGDPAASPYISTATCASCLVASQGYVQAVTNRPASRLIPFGPRVTGVTGQKLLGVADVDRFTATVGFARAQMYREATASVALDHDERVQTHSVETRYPTPESDPDKPV